MIELINTLNELHNYVHVHITIKTFVIVKNYYLTILLHNYMSWPSRSLGSIIGPEDLSDAQKLFFFLTTT